MEGEHRGDADGEQPAESVARVTRDLHAAPEHDKVQKEQRRRTDEAQFLTDNGEDKIRVVLRQEVQLTLRTAEKPLAEDQPR